MSSRSVPERTRLVLGAAAEAIWCGAAAAVLVGASAPHLIAFAWAVVLGAALLAHRWAGRERGDRNSRLLAMTLVLAAAAALMIAGRAWTHPYLPWWFVLAVLYSGGLVALGLSLGSAPPWPEGAVRRAVRAFALLCAVLAVAALAGSAPRWGSWALVAAFVVGGLLVAVVRRHTLDDVIDPVERLPAWPWLLAVVGAVLVVVATGALLSVVLRADVVLWLLGMVSTAVRYALVGLVYLVGWAAILLMRGLAWLTTALHLHSWRLRLHPQPVPRLRRLHPLLPPSRAAWHASRLLAAVAGTLAAFGLAFALILVALRRFRREPPAKLLVLEERETLVSVRSAAGELAAGLVRRLRRRLLGSRRSQPRTPAELVRRRYADLERRLSHAGSPRPAGVTVRNHLTAVATSLGTADAGAVAGAGAVVSTGAPTETGGFPDTGAVAASGAVANVDPAGQADPSAAAAELAAIYEAARYSDRMIDGAQARRFEALARAFGA